MAIVGANHVVARAPTGVCAGGDYVMEMNTLIQLLVARLRVGYFGLDEHGLAPKMRVPAYDVGSTVFRIHLLIKLLSLS